MDDKIQAQTEEELSLRLFIVLTRALNAIKKSVEEEIKSLGLNPTEFAVLEMIYSKGEQPIQKIGEKVLIASSSMTYVVDNLEKKKLIQRKACPKIDVSPMRLLPKPEQICWILFFQNINWH